jgi:hypothetical protein
LNEHVPAPNGGSRPRVRCVVSPPRFRLRPAAVAAGRSRPRWTGPTSHRFITFAGQGIVPIGYAAFGFAIGITAGALIRRTVPAMAVTLAGYAGARAAITALRPHMLPPLTIAEKLPGLLPVQSELNFLGPGSWPQFWSGNWVLASNTLTTAGGPFNHARVYCNGVCIRPGAHVPPPTPASLQKYLHAWLAEQRRTYRSFGKSSPIRPPTGTGRSR